MKNILMNKFMLKATLILLAASSVFFSCNDDDGGGPPDLDHASIIPKDSTLESADRGSTIVIFGSNLATTKEVYFNGALATLNTTLVTDWNIIVPIPSDAPYIGAENKIRVVTDFGMDEIDFALTQPPIISSFDGVAENGATISIKGEFFTGTDAVGFINLNTPEDTLWAEIVDVADDVVRVKVPEGTKIANLYMKTSFGSTVANNTFGLNYIIYAEQLATGWEDWSWSCKMLFNNTTQPMSGAVSWSNEYQGGWGGIQMHYPDLPLNELDDAGKPTGPPMYTYVKFSIYGGPGTKDKQIIFNINWAKEYRITLAAEKWTTVKVPLSYFGSPASLNAFILQDVGNTGVVAPYLIYLDDVGLE